MLPLVLIYLALTLVFGVAGVGVWILRGYGFREFRRPGGRPGPQPGGESEHQDQDSRA